MLQPAWLQRS